jgi:hypothetical protein
LRTATHEAIIGCRVTIISEQSISLESVPFSASFVCFATAATGACFDQAAGA